jgi:hypothetical protein
LKKVIKKSVSSKGNEDPVYVQFREPLANRKRILKAAIDAAKLLQNYEEIRALRKEKENMLKNFSEVVTEAKVIHKRLIERVLPHIKIEKKIMPKKIERTETKVQTEIRKVKPKNDVERLQDELKDIEEKLAKL